MQRSNRFSKVEVKTTDLGKNTHMLEGAGGNVTIAVGTNGVIMVDAQFAPMHDKLKAAIAKITKQPVAYLINTHYHGDHTGGNAAFGKEGAIIVAHQNVKSRLVNPPAGANGQTPPASPPEALPPRCFRTRERSPLRARRAGRPYRERPHRQRLRCLFPNQCWPSGSGQPRPLCSTFRRRQHRCNMMRAPSISKLGNAQTKIVCGTGPWRPGRTSGLSRCW